MIQTGENRIQGEKTSLWATSCNTNHTKTVQGSNPVLRVERPTINPVRNGTAMDE